VLGDDDVFPCGAPAACCSTGNGGNGDFCGCRSQDMLPCTT
jgi:hypothetical protein